MRVKNCNGCYNLTYKYWTSSYKPANYHTVGVCHKYAYCDAYKRRVSEVKRCDQRREDAKDFTIHIGGAK